MWFQIVSGMLSLAHSEVKEYKEAHTHDNADTSRVASVNHVLELRLITMLGR